MNSIDEDISYVAIAVIPPQPAKGIICDLSRTLAKQYDSWWLLDEEDFPPHISTWLAYVPTRNIPFIAQDTTTIVSRQAPFGIRINGFQVSEDGHVGLQIESSTALLNLHSQLINQLNKWREGYIHPKYSSNPDKFSKAHWESIVAYGTRFAGATFAPHITASIIPKERLDDLRANPPQVESDISIRELVMFKQAVSGKSVTILGTYKFLG